jgi:hypothetical protein
LKAKSRRPPLRQRAHLSPPHFGSARLPAPPSTDELELRGVRLHLGDDRRK